MIKLDQTDLHNAQVWFDNLKKQLSDPGVLLTEQGLEDIATLLHMKKVGRWDDLMNEHQITALKAENNKINDVANLIDAYYHRRRESENYTTPPTAMDLDKTLYQLVSQILKVLRVEMDAANIETVEETDAKELSDTADSQ